MNSKDATPGNRDEQLAELVLQYIDAVEVGEPIDRKEFIARHPEFREELEQYFAGRDEIERVAMPIRRAAADDRAFPFGESADLSFTDRRLRGSRDPSGTLGRLGDFRLIREIGRGGMGIVYQAEQISLRRHVALKVLPFAAAVDSKLILRFKNEALAAGMLHHPHIVPVYSVGNERGVHFYAMQLIEGQSLAALIAGLRQREAKSTNREQVAADPVHASTVIGDENDVAEAQAAVETTLGGRCETDFPFQQDLSSQHSKRDDRFFRTAARLILQAAEALQHAHDSGIVHRDIKPANLLVDLGGQLRITDFGLAQFHSQVGFTRTGDTLGTLRYMSPEQAAGKRTIVDHRTDVYSLGATFYELLTLSPIFGGHDVQELLTQIFEVQPRPLRTLDRSIPVELETIVLKATSKSTDDRYHSASDMAADLRRYLDNQPILARRPSLVDRARKWGRRHPVAVLASLAVMVVVSAISLTAIVLIDRAYHQERLRANEAESQFQLARRSVDELVRVSEEELAFNPSAESLRRRLLSSVLAYYQEFIESRKNDLQATETLAEARDRVERILDGLRALRSSGQIKLLGQPIVIDELRLSERQQDTAKELLGRVEGNWHGLFRDIGRMPAGELDRRFMEGSRLVEADLKAMLSEEQLRRLHQLDLQADVAAALREPEVVNRVKPTESQRDRIKTIEQQEMANWKASHHPDKTSEGPGSGEEAKLSKNQRILEVLTSEQAIAWRELTGVPLAGLHR